MTPTEVESALIAAFAQCDAALCSLTQKQKEILLQAIALAFAPSQGSKNSTGSDEAENFNPLDELTSEERRSLLEFVQVQEKENRTWTIELLNDWVLNRDSGAVQFIRDRYGFGWLSRIKPIHLAEYYEAENDEALKIKVGSRIEVSNSLWEWVQETGPCTREWFPCTVIGIYETDENDGSSINCLIRFDNGTEYEIQGIYEWNSYNWRWTT